MGKHGDDTSSIYRQLTRELAYSLGFEATGPGVSLVYQLTPVQGLGFGRGPFSHTRWDFTK